MLLGRFFTICIFVCVVSCTPSKPEVSEIAPSDTVQTSPQIDSDTVLNQQLVHPPHEEDRDFPWYDTQYAGGWIKEEYLDSLVKIFSGDTTRSLYEYTIGINQCKGQLLMIEIEGCAKENVFYLKSSGCDEQYISKSTFGVGERSKFTLVNVVTGTTYRVESPEYNELYIDGDRFVQHYSDLSKLERKLDGTYRVFNAAGALLDTVEYQSGTFKNSNRFSNMNLIFLTYINGHRAHVKPTLDHSDLVYVRYYTGDSTKVELVDDRGEGMGSYEVIPKLKHIEYDLKRTSTGFELHNAYDGDERKFIENGLVLRFERIADIGEKKREKR